MRGAEPRLRDSIVKRAIAVAPLAPGCSSVLAHRERRLQRWQLCAFVERFNSKQLRCQADLPGESSTMVFTRFQYRLRSLFLLVLFTCLGSWTARIICFHQQARFHHGQVQMHLREREKMFWAGRTFSQARWTEVHTQLALACACEHAVCHPWLTLVDARTEVAESRKAR